MVCVLSFFRSSDSSFQPYLGKAYYKGYESHTLLKTVVIMKCELWSIFIWWVKISLDIEVAQPIFKAPIKSWRESLFHFRSPHLLNSLFLVGDIHLPNYTNAKWLDELLIRIKGQPLCNYFLFDGCACCKHCSRVSHVEDCNVKKNSSFAKIGLRCGAPADPQKAASLAHVS